MGCGCVTPASTINIENGQIFHSIKITKIQKGSRRKIGQIIQSQEKLQTQSFSKKEFENSKKNIMFDSNNKLRKNTCASVSSSSNKNALSVIDFNSSKKRKNVKFKDQPKFSIKLQNFERISESSQKIEAILFDKQNSNSKQLLKKPKYTINRVRTENNQFLPKINCKYASNDIYSQSFQASLKNIQNVDLSDDTVLKSKQIKTEQNDPILTSLKETVLFGQKNSMYPIIKKSLKLERFKTQNTKRDSKECLQLMLKTNFQKSKVNKELRKRTLNRNLLL